jgi:creatinine amidohydrolase
MSSNVTEMTYDELDSKVKKIGVALVPAGSIERHGKHLPMKTDSATAFEVARRVGDKTGAVVFPCLDYGITEHPAFRGVFLSDKTYSSVVKEICLGLQELGFKKILFISGHGPNNSCISKVLKELFEKQPNQYLLGMAHCMTLVNQLMPDFVEDQHLGHSDFVETSVMLAIDEKHVYPERFAGPEKLERNIGKELKIADVHLVGLDKGRIHLFHANDELEIHGGYGHVSSASKEQGENVLSNLVDFLSRVVDELREIELPLSQA